MPPLQKHKFTGVLHESDIETTDGGLADNVKEFMVPSKREKVEIFWSSIYIFTLAHIISFYGIYLSFTSAHWQTLLFTLFSYGLANLGITAGVHRLWSHRSYKARMPLQIFLMLCSTIAHQKSAFHWAREHRVHHKYTETDADPTNSKRGFFFAHVGWLLCKRHPEVRNKVQNIDVSDLTNNPVVSFQHKYYAILVLFIAIIFPLVTPVYFWNETWLNSFCIPVTLRWVCGLHAAWIVNSFAHLTGNRPYDQQILPADNLYASFITCGEGFHNFHHVFPWDYRASELGYTLNSTSMFLDIMAKIGQAYDMKTVSNEMIEKRTKRTGDGTHNIWGWGDSEQDLNERENANITHRKPIF